MKRTTRIGWIAVLATGLSVAAFGAAKSERKGPSPEQRKEFLEKRISKLSADEQRLARELFPLRDSLMHAVGDYHHKVKEGAEPRSLTAERNAIAAVDAQIQRLQTENKEVWLDLLARMPGPDGPRFGGHRLRPDKGDSNPPPPEGADGDGPDDLPPPSPPAP